MYKKILSTILFFFCLFSLSDIQAGSFSYLNAVYYILLRSEIEPGLNVVKTGSGTGVVTSDTTIDCGTVCNEVFNASSDVTLTATPTAGSFFAGWSGGGCTGLDSTCVVQVDQNSSITVNAEFTFDPTESEPNNSSESANPIPLNVPIYGSIDAISDTDWFSFDATGEDTVTIQFDFPDLGNDLDDWHVQLYASNNVSTPLRDVYVNKGDTFNLDTTGDITYYLVVSKDASHTITNYEFTIITGNSDPAETEVPITGTNDHLNATALPFDTVMHGNLTDIDADQDWYKLQTAGSTITTQIEFAAPYSTSKDWVVTVYADNAGALGQMLSRTAVTDGSVCYVALPNTSSIFYVMVTDLTDISNNFEGRSYTLTVHTGITSVTGEQESNDIIGNATPINLAVTPSLSGQLALSNNVYTPNEVDDTDWFSFDLTAGGASLNFSSPETSPNVWWTVEIDEIAGSSQAIFNGGSLNVTVPSDGTYHLSVTPGFLVGDKVGNSAQYVITPTQ
jgi:hypothetical protein